MIIIYSSRPSASSTIKPRKHPRGKKSSNESEEEKKLELLEKEVNSKSDYMNQTLRHEERKVELLEKLVNHITSQ